MASSVDRLVGFVDQQEEHIVTTPRVFPLELPFNLHYAMVWVITQLRLAAGCQIPSDIRTVMELPK